MHLQFRGVSLHLVHGHDVNVHHTVHLAAFGVAVGAPAQLPLYLLQAGKHLHWLQVADQSHADVHEGVGTLVAPRFRFNYVRQLHPAVTAHDALRRAADVETAVA